MGWLDELLASLPAQQGQVPVPQYQQPPPQQGGGFGQALGDIGAVLQQIGGHAIDALGIASAINSGNLGGYLHQQRAALQDPAFREGLSPFQAGMYGQYLHRTPQGLAPDLPPLGPEQQMRQAQQQYETGLYQQAIGGNVQAGERLGYRTQQPRVGPYEFATYEEAQAAGAPIGAVPHPTNRGTWGIARPPTPPAGSWGWTPPTPAGGAPPAAPQTAPQPAPTAAPPPPGVAAPPAPDAAAAGPDAEGFEDWNTFVQRQSQPEGEARVGYPSPAFVDSGGIVKSRTGEAAHDATMPNTPQRYAGQPPGLPAPQPQLFRAGPSAMPPGQAFLIPETPGPGERVTKKISPDVTVTKGAPPKDKENAQITIHREMMARSRQEMTRSLAAVDDLMRKGILTDDWSGTIGGNLGRLELAGRGPKSDPAAVYLIRNLPSLVPTLSRAMGEGGRPSIAEEKRLQDALSLVGVSASALKNVLQNYSDMMSTGRPSPWMQANFPEYAEKLGKAFDDTLTPEQQQFLGK